MLLHPTPEELKGLTGGPSIGPWCGSDPSQQNAQGAIGYGCYMAMLAQAIWGRILTCPAPSFYLAYERPQKGAPLKEELRLDEERRPAAMAGADK